MPAITLDPSQAEISPFADLIPTSPGGQELIGGLNGEQAFQRDQAGNVQSVPKAMPTGIFTPDVFSDLIPPASRIGAVAFSGKDQSPFADLIPQKSETEQALAETPDYKALDATPEQKPSFGLTVASAIDKLRGIGIEALSAISPEMAARVFGATDASLRPEEKAKPLISQENAREFVGQLPAWAGGNAQFAQGATEAAAGALSDFSNPTTLAQLPAFLAPGVAENFALNVFHDLPKQYNHLKETINQYGFFSKETGQAATEAGITDLMGFLAAKGGTAERFRATRSEINRTNVEPTLSTTQPKPGEPNAVPIGSTTQEVPRPTGGGQDQPQDSGGIRPGEQGNETTGARPEEAPAAAAPSQEPVESNDWTTATAEPVGPHGPETPIAPEDTAFAAPTAPETANGTQPEPVLSTPVGTEAAGGVPSEILPPRGSVEQPAPESGLPADFVSVGASTGADIPEPAKISIAKEKVNERRASEGNLPVLDENPAKNAATYAEAERRIEADRDYGSRILDSLRDGTRTSVDHVEEAALMHEAVTIRNQREAAAERSTDPHASEEDRATAHDDWVRAEERLNQLDQATKLAGQSAARVLQLRRSQIRDDYTFAGIERQARVAKQRPLTPEETAKIKEQADQIAQHQAEIARLQAELDTKNRENTAQAGFEQTQKEVKKSERKNTGAKKVVDVDKQRQNIIDGMKEHVANGGNINDLYSFVQKLSENIHREAVQKGETITRQTVTDKIHDILTKEVGIDLPKEFTGEEGVPNTQDLISGIGRSTPLTTDPVKLAKMETREQLQKVGKINRYLKKLAAPFTGTRRKPSSAESRALEKEGRELAKKMGVQVTDPATQLKNSLEATKTRLRNEIADLNRAIALREPLVPKTGKVQLDAEGERLKGERDAKKKEYTAIFGDPSLTDEARLKIAMGAAERAEAAWTERLADAKKGIFDRKQPGRKVTSPELEAIKARVEASKAAVKELRDNDENLLAIKEAKATQAKQKALQKQIDALKEKIAGRDVVKGRPVNRPAAPELEPLLQQRDMLNDALAELRKKPPVEKVARTSEEIALQSAKTRIANANAALLDKLAGNNFDKAPPRAKLVPDEELRYHQRINEQLKAEIQQGRMKDELARRNWFQKMTGAIANLNRVNILGHLSVLEHLAGAAVENVATRPIGTAIAQVMRFNKTLEAIRKKATYEGGYSIKSELAGARGMIGSLRATLDKFKSGKSELDWLHDTKIYPKEFGQMVSNVHAMIKEPVRQGIYARSMQLNTEAAIKMGLDPTHDKVLREILSKEAYDNANMDIMMGDNFLTKALHGVVGGYLRGEKTAPGLAKFTADVLDILFPIVNVSTNIAIRKFRLAAGLPEAAIRIGVAAKRGELSNRAATLTPRDAELITKSMKYGLFGVALSIYAWNHPQQFGGVFVPGVNAPRDKSTGLAPGEIALPGGGKFSHHFAHGPVGSDMNLIADARRLYDKEVRDNPNNKWSALTEAAFFSLFAGVKDLPAFSTIGRLTSPFKSAGAKMGEMVRNMFEFGLMQDAARMMDTKERKAKTFSQEIQSGIPGLRKNVPEKKGNGAVLPANIGIQ